MPEPHHFLNNQVNPRFAIPDGAQTAIMRWIQKKGAMPSKIRSILGLKEFRQCQRPLIKRPQEFFMRL
jgi:hypothetical protein